MSKLSAMPLWHCAVFFSLSSLFLLKQQQGDASSEESRYFGLFCHLYLSACVTTECFAICSKQSTATERRISNTVFVE